MQACLISLCMIDAIVHAALKTNHDTSECDMQEDGLDIKAMPEFVHLEKGGNKMSGLRFDIVVETAMVWYQQQAENHNKGNKWKVSGIILASCGE